MLGRHIIFVSVLSPLLPGQIRGAYYSKRWNMMSLFVLPFIPAIAKYTMVCRMFVTCQIFHGRLGVYFCVFLSLSVYQSLQQDLDMRIVFLTV